MPHLAPPLMSALQGAVLEGVLPRGALNMAARRAMTADLAETVAEIVALLAPGLVLEIGAHAAEFSRGMKLRLPHARVTAFEANHDVFARHQAAVAAGGVEFVNRCIAAERRTFEFHVPVTDKARTTMGSLRRDSHADHHLTQRVEGVRLDDFLGPDRAKRNVMWIDVEGAIGDVLDGAAETLGACVALYTEMESASRWTGEVLDAEVIQRLAAHDLVPVLRDVQREWQYNALFVRGDALTPEVEALCADFLGRQGDSMRALSGGLRGMRGRIDWLAHRGAGRGGCGAGADLRSATPPPRPRRSAGV